MMKHGLAVLLLLLLPGLAAGSTYYKCVADNGRVIYSATPCGGNAQVKHFKDDLDSSGKLQLVMDSSHSYHVDGTVGSQPVTFVVDTGATNTVVSSRVAAAAGLGSCDGVARVATANGETQICTLIVPEITFGGFHVRHLRVGILPNLSGDALLGMDVLGRLKISQENNVLYISGN